MAIEKQEHPFCGKQETIAAVKVGGEKSALVRVG